MTLVIALAALATVVSVLQLRHMENPFLIPDANQYFRMAQGQTDLVHQPFVSRPLAPLLVRHGAALLHISLQRSFFLLGLVSLAFTLLVTLGLAARSAAPRWVLFAIAAVPFWPILLHGYALPDIWYAAMLGCLLLCLASDRPMLTALMFFPLMLSRESTLLTLVCLLAIAWRRLRVRGCVTAIAATVLGSAVVRHLSAGAPSNPEHLPAAFYLGAKVPWNFLRNIGIDPWSNVYPYLCGSPIWRHAIRLGPLQGVGVCQFSEISPFQAVFALCTEFGFLVALLAVVWRGRRRVGGEDLLTRFCLLYGGISVALAPMLGTAFERLFGYAWPLFLVALPRLYPERTDTGESAAVGRRMAAAAGFLALQVAIGAVGVLPGRNPEVVAGVGLEVVGILFLVTPFGTSLRASWSPEPASSRGKMGTGNRPEQADFS